MLEAVGGRGERGPMRRAIGQAEVYRPTDPGVFSPVPGCPDRRVVDQYFRAMTGRTTPYLRPASG